MVILMVLVGGNMGNDCGEMCSIRAKSTRLPEPSQSHRPVLAKFPSMAIINEQIIPS